MQILQTINILQIINIMLSFLYIFLAGGFMEKFIINSENDGYHLDVHVFEIKKPTAIIQVVHGMEEHQERYEEFARILNKAGFTVVTSDMRGHGHSAENLGFFKNKKGYLALIDDQKTITKWIKEKYPKKQVYLFAHSMGTIISRVLLQDWSKEYSKVILSGYPNYQAGAGFGIFVAGLIKTFRGAKYKSKFLQSTAVGSFNKKIKNPKTDVDWVCKNEKTVKTYIADPLCGFGFTCSAFSDLFHLVKLMHKPKRYKEVNKSMPILMLRGTDDPCTGGYKGAKDSIRILKKAGFEKVKYIDYPNMRHEIINELGNKVVYDDIVKFFQS